MKHAGKLLVLALFLAPSTPAIARVCPEGWTGPYCDIPVDYCSPDPCVHGSCYNDFLGYTCSCDPGWDGTNCEIPTPSHKGMTWTLLYQRPDNVVRVGADPLTDAYYGDTAASASLPILCILVNASPVPSGIYPDSYAGWAKGHVALTPPVFGTALTSLSVANSYCSNYLGQGWRIAEFHDGYHGQNLTAQSGWSFWAFGTIPANTRFWTYINDQPANPWN